MSAVKITLVSGQQFTKTLEDDEVQEAIEEIVAQHGDWVEVDGAGRVRRDAIIALEPA